MPVTSLSHAQKEDIYEMFVEDGYTKTALGEKFAVSVRTIGRVIDEIKDYVSDVEPDIDWEDDFDGELDDADIDWGEEFEEDVVVEETFNFVLTQDSVAITRISEDDCDTQVIGTDHKMFDKVYELIYIHRGSQDSLKEAYELLDVKKVVERVTKGVVTIIPEEFRVVYEPAPGMVQDFSGRLVNRLIDAATDSDEGAIEGLMNFANKLTQNPSFRAVNELYDFLEAADIRINQDGMVECYKKITADFKDCYTRTIDNSVGALVSVPRNLVDEDSEQTCSYGLHVCSESYLDSYPGEVIVRVLVHPADFVAIPKDYYSLNGANQVKAKARVSRYYVAENISSEYEEYCF